MSKDVVYKTTVWGWDNSYRDGLVRFNMDKNKEYSEVIDDKMDKCGPPVFTLELERINKIACFPLGNFYAAIYHFEYAINIDSSEGVIHEEDRTKFRIYCVIAGVAELTWVLGIILHVGTNCCFKERG